MQQNLSKEVPGNIRYLVGAEDILKDMADISAKKPFDESILAFLDVLSKKMMKLPEAKVYPDIMTLAFWLRKSSMIHLKKRFEFTDECIHLGRGVVFHIAPSNVPVNYAYSLVTGLITGNANIVRIPSKDFPQVNIINNALNDALEEYPELKKYICLIRYERDQTINDILSSIADVRIIWGGDSTIEDIRRSPLKPRAGEITFADRYSLAVIDSDHYLEMKNKVRTAEEFYNDTYLTDQNACTSPRLVVWTGNRIESAKKIFWENLHKMVKKKYVFQAIQGINKLTSSYLMAVHCPGIKILNSNDNLIIRVEIQDIVDDLMDMKDNSGYFFEYDCDDILDLRKLCDDNRCQTIAYIGDKEMFMPLIYSGVKGIDRIVPIGQTMDFDLLWDGYNLAERLTRSIAIKG